MAFCFSHGFMGCLRLWRGRLLPLVAFGLLTGALVAARPMVTDGGLPLRAGSYDPLTPAGAAWVAAERAALPPAAAVDKAAGEPALFLMQFAADPGAAELSALQAAGGTLIQPFPGRVWLVELPASSPAGGIKEKLRWSGEWLPAWKLHPIVREQLAAVALAGADAAKRATAPKRGKSAGEVAHYHVQVTRGGGRAVLSKAAGAAGAAAQVLADFPTFETWVVATDAAGLQALAQQPRVIWIEPQPYPVLCSEREALAGGGSYAAWLAGAGLSGAGEILQLVDDGFSRGEPTLTSGTQPADFAGRVVGFDNPTGDAWANSTGGHGHLNASIALGRPLAGGGRLDPQGYLLGQGVAPDARLFVSKLFNNQGAFSLGSSSLNDLARRAWRAGARVSTNSWGSAANGAYDTMAQIYDLLTRDADGETTGSQPLLHIFAAGNSGPWVSSISSPATAKNVVAVGASENFPRLPVDGCGTMDIESDHLLDVVGFSARGPTADGRLGPTVMAPGTQVAGAASDDPGYDAQRVCGRQLLEPGEASAERRYWPAGQHDYTVSSGTSHATPAVAGAALLLHELWRRVYGQLPSPAMVKALLVAGAQPMTGGDLNDGTFAAAPPNVDTGWGLADIAPLVAGVPHDFALDQTRTLTAADEVYEQTVFVRTIGQPLRIVLAWSDALAPVAASTTLINDLDLEVSDGASTWLGNQLQNGVSVAGGEPDRVNNLEVVQLAAPRAGAYTVRVRAHRIAGDADLQAGASFEQDFALYALNGALESRAGVLAFGAPRYARPGPLHVLLSDSDLAGTGTVTVAVTSTANDRELLWLEEVQPARGLFQGWLALDSPLRPVAGDGRLSVYDEATVGATFRDADRGDGQPAELQASTRVDALAPHLTLQRPEAIGPARARVRVMADEPVTVRLRYGAQSTTLTREVAATLPGTSHLLELTSLTACAAVWYRIELTDSVGNVATFPAAAVPPFLLHTTSEGEQLYADFETTAPLFTPVNQLGEAMWRRIDTPLARSGGHCYFVPNPAKTTDAALWSPAFNVEPNMRLGFWHTHDLEAGGGTAAYDGGVLELSADGGLTWDDLGPQLLEGAYDYQIVGSFGNPLAFRMAWSGGTTGTMTRVLADLDPWAGQSVRVRWRLGTDNAFARAGWYIDDVFLARPAPCTTALPQLAGTRPKAGRGAEVDFELRLAGLAEPPPASDFGLAVPEQGEVTLTSASLQWTALADGVWAGRLPALLPGRLPHESRWELGLPQPMWVRDGAGVMLAYHGPGDVVAHTGWVADGEPPALLSGQVAAARYDSARLSLTYDEPVTVRAEALPGEAPLGGGSADARATQEPELSGLEPCSSITLQVRATDEAGNSQLFSAGGAGWSLQTGTAASWSDTFDPPASGWTTQTLTGEGSWHLTTSTLAHAGAQVWVGDCPDAASDHCLVSPPLTIPSHAELSFWHTFDLDSGSFIGSVLLYDGAVLELSLNQGVSWIDLGAYILEDPYTGLLQGSFDNPLGRRSAWSGGDFGPLRRVRVDLSPFAGEGRLLRFRIGTDAALGGRGWLIDDLRLNGTALCGTQPPTAPQPLSPLPGAAGVFYGSAPTLRWQAASGATHYRVQWGPTPQTPWELGATVATEWPLPLAEIKAGTTYWWRVSAVGEGGTTPGPLARFRTAELAAERLREFLLGQGALTQIELDGGDYDNDGRIGIGDLIQNVNRVE